MGFLLSKLWWSSEPEGYDEVDVKTGLTPRQSDIVRNTWELVKKDIKGNGIDLFIMLFERHPEYQLLFRAFADVPREQLKTNGRLLGHATSVMYALTSVVDNLKDPECLTQLLHKIAESHVPRKVDGSHFENLAIVVLQLLEEKLGAKIMNETAKEAWKATLGTMNSVLVMEMEKSKR